MANIDIQMKGPIGPDEVVSVSYINRIALDKGSDYDLGAHIKDVGGRVTSTAVYQGGSPLSSGKVSYDSGTRKLTGITGGEEEGLTLQVEW